MTTESLKHLLINIVSIANWCKKYNLIPQMRNIYITVLQNFFEKK